MSNTSTVSANQINHSDTSATIDRSQDAPWHWQAHLQLRLASSLRSGVMNTTLNRCRHKGPLYVQKPFYPEGKSCAHVYLLHPPGGLVSGDSLKIDVEVEENAHTVITTPGAARMYRARSASPEQHQNITLRVGKNAIMEWFPMETIVYNDAAATVNTTVHMDEGSCYMGWEVTCLGLPASQALMTEGFFKQRYRIFQSGVPVFIDRLYYDAAHQAMFTHVAGMQSNTVSGFFIAGPFKQTPDEQQELVESLRSLLAKIGLEKQMAITLMNDFCVIRYLGSSANQARDGFTAVWEGLRPALIHKKACPPRIWLT